MTGSSATVDNAGILAMWDINRKNAGYWDPHMSLLMLQWLRGQQVYDDSSVAQALKEVLSRTLQVETYTNVTGEPVPPPEMVARAAQTKSEFISIEAQLGPFLACMITVGRERQEADSGAVSGLERKTIREWSVYWHNRQQTAAINGEGGKKEGTAASGGAGKSNATRIQEFSPNTLELVLRYCQMFYASGEYSLCKRWLLFYLDHICEFTVEGRERTDLRLSCLWGLVACMLVALPAPRAPEIVDHGGENGFEEGVSSSAPISRSDASDDAHLIAHNILVIDDILESSKTPRKKLLVNKAWLCHWGVWALMRYYFPRVLTANMYTASGMVNPRSHVPCHIEWTRLIDWMFSEQTLCTVTAVCPQLLRYIAVAAILNRQRQDHFKATVDVISRTNPKHSDLFTSIIGSLFIQFNFEEAQEKLALCGPVAQADFLLAPLHASVEEHARLLIFQTYCRIQKSINIDMIAKKLHMTADTAERWIVNLIRHARLEAKIDSERNRVEIASPSTSVYQQVLEKTRNLLVRTNVLIQNVDRPAGSFPVPISGSRGGDFTTFRRGGPGGNQRSGGGMGNDHGHYDRMGVLGGPSNDFQSNRMSDFKGGDRNNDYGKHSGGR